MPETTPPSATPTLTTALVARRLFLIAWERKAPQTYYDTINGGMIEQVTVTFGYAFAAKGTPDGAFGFTDD